MKADCGRKRAFIIIFLMTIWLVVFQAGTWVHAEGAFPLYPSLKPAVAFWKKIYTQYSTRQGVIHDDRRLDVIYEVVWLEDQNRGGSAKINQERVKAVKSKYQSILQSLADGNPAQSDDEKRVLSFFGKNPDRETLLAAQERVRYQLGQKDRFIEGLICSGRYLDEIKRIFRNKGLPEELAYLPHVESSFNYKAYSKFGAAGIWQFTHATGRRYLTIDYVQDERRDPLRAAHAAATYLKQNYQKLGSWPLALTAYNHGDSGMMRAKAACGGDFEKIVREYNGPSFGFASRNFYAEFLAALDVAVNYQKYFIGLKMDPPVQYEEVVLPGYASIKGLADHFKTDVQTLREYNFALREPVFLGQKYVPKGYRLRLPRRAGQNLVAIVDKIDGDVIRSSQLPTRFYQVRKGDTVSGIAKSQGITTAKLIQANGLSAKAKIYVGQNLRIPSAGEQTTLLAAVAPQTLEKVRSVKTETLLGKGPQTEKPAPNRDREAAKTDKTEKTVKETGAKEEESVEPPVKQAAAEKQTVKEDKPQTTARKEEAPLEAAAKEQTPKADAPETVPAKAAVYKEYIPEEIHVRYDETNGNGTPGNNGQATPAASLSEAEVNPTVVIGDFLIEETTKIGSKTIGVIKVGPEETIGHYAGWLDVPALAIRQLNGLKGHTPLQMDQRLKIPLTKVSKESFEEKRYEYHKELEEDFFSVYRINGESEYMVKKGDNIWALCKKTFEIPFWLIRKYNTGQDFNALQPDDKLRIPSVTRIGEGNS